MLKEKNFFDFSFLLNLGPGVVGGGQIENSEGKMNAKLRAEEEYGACSEPTRALFSFSTPQSTLPYTLKKFLPKTQTTHAHKTNNIVDPFSPTVLFTLRYAGQNIRVETTSETM